MTDEKKIDELLTRGVEDIFIKEHLRERLLSGEQLRIKLGIDPTSPFIHLGRAITLRKLKAFQDLGHQIVLIIGDYTARIGDPSDKLDKRPMLTEQQIKSNLANYLEQIALVIDIKKTEVRHNAEWFDKMNFVELGQLLECFSVQQMIKRRNFKDRMNTGQDVFVVELLYPALQGYDSVAVKSDVEIGGFDQLFNLKAGRTVQKRYGQPEQDIMVLSMLEGTDGRKMSSSWGNIISVVDAPDEMFGKIMALKDELIIKYFLLTTELSLDEISKIEDSLKKGENPMNLKKKLAKTIISLYHSSKEADKAEKNFVSTFQKKEIPEVMEEIKCGAGELLSEVLVKNKIIASKSKWRRLVLGRGVHDLEKNDNVIDQNMKVTENLTLKIGKKRFVKITLK
ncbi:tyrosine--tRNA ligase [Candidatus Nomurabacteria bacterium RIFCSPLOWO2_01_FULL_42_17]|uniref:Tyrosine--tRNA ligase n=1 Tax=Candidatus Nomurabacteria bacterium RIFCSPLOWO2_01_FULL_42_17 TaxID=1801780 RepID=A0A1F6XNC3_9BACT|nr:MAG: tyrosine--tRNA ligase [Candidatus Nomurabacteria bacterium RIFCSPLOWO2_01_FULL_42_17]